MREYDVDHRRNRKYWIWIVIFGAALGLGASLLEVFQIPGLNITAATPWVATVITLNKLIICRKYSVTHMYIISSMIGVFTWYLGPPSPLAIMLILAGYSFDLGTRFRTENIKLYDLIAGHVAATIVGFFLVWVIFRVHLPDIANDLKAVFLVAACWHLGISIAVSAILIKAFPPNNPTIIVKRIRDAVGA